MENLLKNRLTERSPEATKIRNLLSKELPRLDQLRKEVEQILNSALSDNIRITTVLDQDYPLNLRTVFNPPPFLFYRGVLLGEEDAKSVAVVGTREASEEGLKRASNMAKLLVEHGVTVLSGLARGIDTAAHSAALKSNGRTIAVLGSGIRTIYPPENLDLSRRIEETGAVVSQFWPDAPPARTNFPIRNITMSGMGQGTIVIEASQTSGAKMQARLALQHGKKVFLIQSLVTQQPWAQKYLERGAIEVKKINDVLQALRPPEDIRAKALQASQLSFSLG